MLLIIKLTTHDDIKEPCDMSVLNKEKNLEVKIKAGHECERLQNVSRRHLISLRWRPQLL